MTPKLMALPDGSVFLVTTDTREIVRDGAPVQVVDGYVIAPSCCELVENGPHPRFRPNVPAAELVELEAVPHGVPRREREARERGREPKAPRGQGAPAAPAEGSAPAPAKPKGKRSRG